MIAALESRACKVSAPPWVENPYRLVSLREIMAMLFKDDEIFITPVGNLFYTLGALDLAAKSGGALSQTDVIQFEVILNLASQDLKLLGLPASASHAQQIVEILKGEHSSSNVSMQTAMLRASLGAETESTLFLYVRSSEASFYKEPLNGVAEVVGDRFPSTLEDLREAAKCYALGRSAASVFHCMRAVEVGLIALGKILKVPAATSKNWQALLNDIGTARKQINEQSHGSSWREDRQWYAEAAAHLETIKDAWRNDVMHVHRSYNQSRSREILNATRAFMGQIATRLRE